MKPLLTVLNFSGGTGSGFLVELVLSGQLTVEKEKFLVITADTGAELPITYDYILSQHGRLREAGYKTAIVSSGSLESLLLYPDRTKTRIDNPPYWTRDRATGKRGRLKQGCTTRFKVQPMDTEVRKQLASLYPDIPALGLRSRRLGEAVVEKWIGFSEDERRRNKPSKRKYAYFRYPLQELGFTKDDIRAISLASNWAIPQRSVCYFCFANGLSYFKNLYQNFPDAWDKAVKVDELVRDWSQYGVEDEVYVSATLIPLRILPLVDWSVYKFEALEKRLGRGVLLSLEDEGIAFLASQVSESESSFMVDESYSCQSGVCFV